MRAIVWLVSLLLLFPVTFSSAQTDQLTVSQAVQIALDNHPTLKVAGYDLAAAEAQLRGAKARATPEVRVTPGIVGPAGSDEVLFIFQPLEINGARSARTEAASGQLAQTRATAASTCTDLMRQVKQAYWEAALTQQIATLDAESVKYVQTLAEAASTQYELGNQPQVQVFKAEVELARARQQLFRSQAAAAQAIAALNAALGRPPETPVVLSETASPVEAEFQEAQLQALGLAQRPDLLAAQAAVRAARGQVSMARAARRTDVALQARLDDEGLGGMAISLNFPQLDWGGLKASQQRAEALVKMSEQGQAVAANSARLDIANALIALRAAQAQTREYQQKVLELSSRLTDLSLLGYKEGASTFLDVLDARRTLRAVNAEYYSAVAEQLKSLAQLEWAVGGRLPEASPQSPQPTEVK
ncbi:MAG: TolC family protein [Armatimonadota bacterium]